MKTFKLSDVQAGSHPQHAPAQFCASLRKWKSATEDKTLRRGAEGLKKLLGSEAEQWKTIA
jgi:hypothetical protein